MKANLIDYNLKEANKILANLVELTGFNIQDNSRKPTQAYLRAILYKNLITFNYMNDRQISSWFKTQGLTKDRVSILHAIKKIDVYFLNYQGFRNVYNTYYDDRIEESKALSLKTKKTKKNDNFNSPNGFALPNDSALPNNLLIDDPLQNLINKLPMDKRWEIYETLNLRVKSWSWKSNDYCEIIQGSEGVSSTAF